MRRAFAYFTLTVLLFTSVFTLAQEETARAECRVVMVEVSFRATFDQIKQILLPTGFLLDDSYGAVVFDPATGESVVRGRGTPQIFAEIRKLQGFRVFADVPLKPFGPTRASKCDPDIL